MFGRSLLVSAICLSGSLQAATPIDFKAINQVFATVAGEVLKTHQIKDKDGNDVVESIALKLDEKSNLATGDLSLTSDVKMRSALWAPKTPSAVSLLFRTKPSKTKDGEDTLTIAGGLGVSTDVPALVRYAYAESTKSEDPCTEASILRATTKLEEKFNRDACAFFPKLKDVKTSGEFLSLSAGLLKARLDYLEAAIVEAKAASASSKHLEEERVYVKAAVTALATRTDKESVKITVKHELGFTESSFLNSVELSIDAKKVSVNVEINSKEAKDLHAHYSSDLEKYAEVLSRDDKDSEKQATVKDLQIQIEGLLDLAKSLLLAE